MNGSVAHLRLAVEGAAELAAQMAEAQALIDASPGWLRFLAAQAFEQLDERVQLRTVHLGDASAGGARELRVRAQFADELVRLLAAVRAGNGDLGAWIEIEGQLHATPVRD